jgi:hypothetical protein
MVYRDQLNFSVHSPLFAKYFLNLAATDFSNVLATSKDCTPFLKDLKTDIFFFHGFFMTDKPIVHDMKNYRKTIKTGMGDDFSLNGSFIMDPRFFDTERFAQYKEVFKGNLSKLKSEWPDFIISLENDFPGVGSGLQRPAEIHELIDNLWFDLGHFWTSSLLHGFDFHEEANRLLDEKNITGIHLNHNLVKKSSKKELICDSHTHFYLESEMNLAPIVQKIFDKKVGIVVLEILDGDIKDLEVLFSWLG